jgi:hypothetical protein
MNIKFSNIKYPYNSLFDKYNNEKLKFPLIASVINGLQEGFIISSDKSDSDAFFVMHKFGFSQFIGNYSNSNFYNDLYDYLIEKKEFPVVKVRWYAPPLIWVKTLDTIQDKKVFRSERAQYQFNITKFDEIITQPNKDWITESIDRNNFDTINETFGLDLDKRFWSSKKDFMINSFGYAIRINNEYTSICYAAAIANNIAEIDVATKEQYRNKGLGKTVAYMFIRECISKGINPNWDCYTNNIPSTMLAKSLGFELNAVYNLFTINQ